MSQREKITFSEEFIDGSIEDWLPEDYIIEQVESTDFDGEKGFCYYDIIIQRKSDEKFFKGKMTDYGRGSIAYDREWTEVFQRITTKFVYE